jgi:hypothetical protein
MRDPYPNTLEILKHDVQRTWRTKTDLHCALETLTQHVSTTVDLASCVAMWIAWQYVHAWVLYASVDDGDGVLESPHHVMALLHGLDITTKNVHWALVPIHGAMHVRMTLHVEPEQHLLHICGGGSILKAADGWTQHARRPSLCGPVTCPTVSPWLPAHDVWLWEQPHRFIFSSTRVRVGYNIVTAGKLHSDARDTFKTLEPGFPFLLQHVMDVTDVNTVQDRLRARSARCMWEGYTQTWSSGSDVLVWNPCSQDMMIGGRDPVCGGILHGPFAHLLPWVYKLHNVMREGDGEEEDAGTSSSPQHIPFTHVALEWDHVWLRKELGLHSSIPLIAPDQLDPKKHRRVILWHTPEWNKEREDLMFLRKSDKFVADIMWILTAAPPTHDHLRYLPVIPWKSIAHAALQEIVCPLPPVPKRPLASTLASTIAPLASMTNKWEVEEERVRAARAWWTLWAELVVVNRVLIVVDTLKLHNVVQALNERKPVDAPEVKAADALTTHNGICPPLSDTMLCVRTTGKMEQCGMAEHCIMNHADIIVWWSDTPPSDTIKGNASPNTGWIIS